MFVFMYLLCFDVRDDILKLVDWWKAKFHDGLDKMNGGLTYIAHRIGLIVDATSYVDGGIISWNKWTVMGPQNRLKILELIDMNKLDTSVLDDIPPILRDSNLPSNYHGLYYEWLDKNKRRDKDNISIPSSRLEDLLNRQNIILERLATCINYQPISVQPSKTLVTKKYKNAPSEPYIDFYVCLKTIFSLDQSYLNIRRSIFGESKKDYKVLFNELYMVEKFLDIRIMIVDIIATDMNISVLFPEPQYMDKKLFVCDHTNNFITFIDNQKYYVLGYDNGKYCNIKSM
ncbi:hypothetical protein HK099_000293 [Clydaea vesicula]|uniref:Uncharacterized protein n=1 Tax=Clydaea vesicula TaxID=447962 RepID=A0AAD5U4C3_9FUNG|nr:hypothetical protein HK099_000293 [Clydaea vesicula]